MILAKSLLGGVIAAVVMWAIILAAYTQRIRAEMREHGAAGLYAVAGRMELSPAKACGRSPAHRSVRYRPVYHGAHLGGLKVNECNRLITAATLGSLEIPPIGC